MLRSVGVGQAHKAVGDKVQEVAFDFVLDGWDRTAAELQATSDVMLIGLPRGFYGGIVVRGLEDWSRLVHRFCHSPRQ